MTRRAFPLSGRVALVTGAARGIGRAYALRLAGLGASVAVVDRDLRSYAEFETERMQMTHDSTAQEIQTLGGTGIGIEVDATDRRAMHAACERIARELGGIDIAVCNAGGGAGTFSETTGSKVQPDVLDLVVQRNLYSAVNTCAAAAPYMKEAGYGRIVTVSSHGGHRVHPSGGYAHYAAAKSAVEMYTKSLAQELGPFGITVNCIAPGHIATGRVQPIIDAMSDDIVRTIALRRVGSPDDCAGVLEFLVTGLGDYVTGAVIDVDGGATFSG